MTAEATKVVAEFKKLPPLEQRLVWNELAQMLVSTDYGPLTDQELTSVADQTFVLLDSEEADAKSR